MNKLEEWFQPNCSPYLACFQAGSAGYPIEEVEARCNQIGTELRLKDYQNWVNGRFKARVQNHMLDPVNGSGIVISNNYSDFNTFPDDWQGTERRFFPCTSDNKPMMKWGWSNSYNPQLMTIEDARCMSKFKGGPGWVGQNMLYQPFVVIDIDGEGHGVEDHLVYEWGKRYRDVTLSMGTERKPMSFHLYFTTNKIMPVRHFPYAKVDFMGNAVNAAVYMKDKVSNEVPMLEMTKDIWNDFIQYTQSRKVN